MTDLETLGSIVDLRRDAIITASDLVRSTPETCCEEKCSAAAHAAELERQCFTVRRDVADIPTGPMGEAAGEGKVGTCRAYSWSAVSLPDSGRNEPSACNERDGLTFI